MASANIGATVAPAKATRTVSEIIDEIRGRSYDLCGLAAVVDKLVESDPPGSWADVFWFLRSSLNDVSEDLHSNVAALCDAEDGR